MRNGWGAARLVGAMTMAAVSLVQRAVVAADIVLARAPRVRPKRRPSRHQRGESCACEQEIASLHQHTLRTCGCAILWVAGDYDTRQNGNGIRAMHFSTTISSR